MITPEAQNMAITKLWWLTTEFSKASGKESTAHAGDRGFDPWVGKIPWSWKWHPTPVFLPGESPWTEEPHGLQSTETQSQTWLSGWAHSSVAWVWSPARICCQEFWDISLYTNACYRISTILNASFFPFFLPPSLPQIFDHLMSQVLGTHQWTRRKPCAHGICILLILGEIIQCDH